MRLADIFLQRSWAHLDGQRLWCKERLRGWSVEQRWLGCLLHHALCFLACVEEIDEAFSRLNYLLLPPRWKPLEGVINRTTQIPRVIMRVEGVKVKRPASAVGHQSLMNPAYSGGYPLR